MITSFEVIVPGQKDTVEFTLYHSRAEDYCFKALLTTEDGGYEMHVATLEVGTYTWDLKDLMREAYRAAINYVRSNLELKIKGEEE